MRKTDCRNEETKTSLVQAFKKLSMKQGVAKVSVTDIAKYCQLDRNTFYYHFEDIRSLLNWMFERDCAKIIVSLNDGDVKDLIRSCIYYVQENHALLRDTFENLGSDSLRRAFEPTFTKTAGTIVANFEAQQNVTLDSNYRKFLIYFFCEAVGGTMLAYARGLSNFESDELIDDITAALESIPLFLVNCRHA